LRKADSAMTALLETLAAYVPPVVAQRFAGAAAPAAARFPAAVLMADIAGFTRLAESLAGHGPGGAEELSQLLNRYFAQLIDVVLAHGGEIVRFAGDAPLVLWPAGPQPGALEQAVLCALHCGLALQAALHDYPAAPGQRLALRVGIGAGDALLASVGGAHGRWEFVLAGAPLAQMSRAEREAAPGEVVLSPEAWALAARHADGALLPSGAARVTATRTPFALSVSPKEAGAAEPVVVGDEAALRRYIPRVTLERLDAGGVWLAELRRVTVLFAGVNGLVEPELERLQAVVSALQDVIYRYDGSINQIVVDDAGLTLVAAWGLPGRTHEDDAARAVQAALDLEARVAELQQTAMAGIAGGRVFCGERGSGRRREYAMIGDVVNLAARLMQAAGRAAGPPGVREVLCDAATAQAAQARLAFEELPPLAMKGKARPVAVYRPRAAAAPAAGERGAVVGRQVERGWLVEQLMAPGAVIVVEGEAGIGKSYLLQDVCAQAAAAGARILAGAGDALEHATPYHAWGAVFGRVLDLPAHAPAETRRAALQARLSAVDDPRAVQLAPLLNAVVPLDLPENELTAQLDGELRAENTRALLLGLLRAYAAQGPALLVLEDAHWLDSASWQLLLALVERPPAALQVIVVSRPPAEPRVPEYERLLAVPGVRRLALAALAPEDVGALVCRKLGVAAAPAAMLELIAERAGGNPFFSEQLAYALRDAGLIVVSAGDVPGEPAQCSLAPGADLRALVTPDTIEGVVLSRIDRLPPAEQLALKVASVIGRVFAYRVLHGIYPLADERPRLAAHLEGLERRDLTALEATTPERAYLFKHIITQEVAYNLMLFVQRRQLHRAAAEWYEQAQAIGEHAELDYLLAHHWSRAVAPGAPEADVLRAIHYLERAGERAMTEYALAEAPDFLARAIELAAPVRAVAPLRRVRWERQISQAYWLTGRRAEAITHLTCALELLGRPLPRTRLAHLFGAAAQARQILVRHLPIIGATTQALDERRRDALLEAARVYQTLAEVLYFDARSVFHRTAFTGLTALNLTELAGPSPELVRAYASGSVAVTRLHLHWLSRHFGRLAAAAARQIDDLPAQGWERLTAGLRTENAGQWAQAREAAEAAVTIFARLGDRRRWEQAHVVLAMVAYYQGEFAACLEWTARSLPSALQRGDRFTQVQLGMLRGRAQLALGQTGAALETLMAAHIALGDLSEHPNALALIGTLGLAHWQQGDRTAARALALEGRARSARALEDPPWAELLLALWADGEAEWAAPARAACALLRATLPEVPRLAPCAWRCAGEAAWLEGRPGAARRAWRRAVAEAERLGMPAEAARARAALARGG
jgi:class 3 adenylate cyclase